MLWYSTPDGIRNLTDFGTISVRDKKGPGPYDVQVVRIKDSYRQWEAESCETGDYREDHVVTRVLATFGELADAERHLDWIRDKIAAGVTLIRHEESPVAAKHWK